MVVVVERWRLRADLSGKWSWPKEATGPLQLGTKCCTCPVFVLSAIPLRPFRFPNHLGRSHFGVGMNILACPSALGLRANHTSHGGLEKRKILLLLKIFPCKVGRYKDGTKRKSVLMCACVTSMHDDAHLNHSQGKPNFIKSKTMKNLSKAAADLRGEGQTPFPVETTLSSRSVSQQTFSFDVRMNKSEKEVINKLSRDFSESIVTVITKSLRVYRAISEAAGEGGSLVMQIKKSGTSFGSKGIYSDSVVSDERLIQKPYLVSPKSLGTRISVAERPSSSGINVINERKDTANYSDTISEAIIAVRDQFADNGLIPVRLNAQYITPPKGPKNAKITIKVDTLFNERIHLLEQRTGLNKSVIVRDSIQLYDFIKRKFNNEDISFFIGGTPITAI